MSTLEIAMVLLLLLVPASRGYEAALDEVDRAVRRAVAEVAQI